LWSRIRQRGTAAPEFHGCNSATRPKPVTQRYRCGHAGRIPTATLTSQNVKPRLYYERTVGAIISDAGKFHEQLSDEINAEMSALDVVRQAVPFFAAELALESPELDRIGIREEHSRVRVLDLHAAALLAVLTVNQQVTEVQIDLVTVLAELLVHEQRYWRGRAENLNLLGGPQGLTVGQLSQIVAAGCLLGAQTEADAMALLGRVPHVTASWTIASWLHDLYPPAPGEGWLGSLRPDRLAELHVTRQLEASPDLARACLTDLDERQARRALILLAQASTDYPEAKGLLEPALFRFSEVISGIDAQPDTMIAIANAIPSPSVTLGKARLDIVSRILAALPPGTADRALWLHESGQLLAGMKRWQEALARGTGGHE